MHIPGSWILLLFVALMAAVALVLLRLTEAGHLVHQRIPDRPHRRLLLVGVGIPTIKLDKMTVGGTT
ncbi:MAG TPA: hypothetical protein VK593_04770 [Edaphobacter sp.]|nr:hypothetical protein [Edaphobacter sp.]